MDRGIVGEPFVVSILWNTCEAISIYFELGGKRYVLCS